MLSGLYSAASGMNVATIRQDVLAHNLAHATVPGFKRTHVSFEAFGGTGYEPDNYIEDMGTRTSQHASDFSAGAHNKTNRNLDLAISGEGFFVVDGPGGPLFTRNGVFYPGPSGGLVTSEGHTVTGSSTIPLGVTAEAISVSADGNLSVDGVPFGKLKIVSFPDVSKLRPAGTTMFAAPPGVVPGEATGTIEQGTRESSNVSSVLEMVQMIAGMRQHEASSKAFQVIADAIRQHTNAGAR